MARKYIGHPYIIDSPGGTEHHGQWIHNGSATSAALVLPLDGAPIYVSLKTYLPGGTWYQRTVEYSTAIAPTDENGTRIISPTPDSTLTQSSTTFRWIGDAESTSYHIRLGSSHRGHDLVAATLGAQATEYTVDLPIDGDPIYVSIATFLPGGAYYYRDYVYQTSNTPRATGVHFYINDHLGTPQQLVNSDQAITWAADYDAFGAATVTTELVSNNHRFPGQYFDAESGLHYNWHRYYDPETGRYTRSDPIGLDGGLNTFGYVGGNPVNGIDYLGLIDEASLGFGGNIPRFGPVGAGGEGGVLRITCCKNGEKFKQEYAYIEAGPSIGLSVRGGVDVTITNILSEGELPSCTKPNPALWRLEILVFSFTDQGVDVGMRLGLAYRYNVVRGFKFLQEIPVNQCC